jgi:GT2 family glycosyltransferase
VSPNIPQGQHVVTAVIVAHDGAAWLPQMAEALLSQTRPVQRVVAVDTGSRDRSGAVLAGLLGRSVVFGMDRATGYGAAVGQALRHRAANTNVPGPAGLPQGERTEWVWLLHDDCEPAPDALEQLLLGAAETRSAAVLGPKVMDWADRRVLLEAGVTIDGAGRRITGIEPREVDQGQHDGDRDVLAVGSAGMLVRRDVWDQVGGFDPAMVLFREDVDFCWRIHAAGYRVRVITDAVVYHLEASARNRRVASAAPRPQRTDRQNALFTLLTNLPGGPAVNALIGNLTLTVLRTILFLLAKRPGAALDETAAFAWIAGHPLRVLAARHRRARGRRGAYSQLRSDLPRGRSLMRLVEFVSSALSRSSQLDTAGSHHAMDDPNDDDTLLVDTGFAQRILTNPGVLLFAGLLLIALVAGRSLLGPGPISGGALLPAWGGASGLWHEYLAGFHPAGIGSAGATPPYVAVLAALASLLGGKPWLAVDVIMIGCVPLAGLTAFFAARRITDSVPARVWAGAAYALLPVGIGAVAAGRLGAAVAFTLIPLIGVQAARIFTQPRRRARRAAWATGLTVAIAAAFVPLVWLAAVLAAALGALAFGRARGGILVNLGLVALVPPVLLVPWSWQVAVHPALIFLQAGQQVTGLASAHLSARSLLLLSPGGPGLPPYWVTAGLALAALAALLLTGRRTLIAVGWSVALLGLLISVGVSRLLVTPDGGGPAIAAWPGISLAIAAAGLLLAATVAGGNLRAHLAGGKWHSPRGAGVALVALAAGSAPLLAAGFWLVTGVSGPVGVASGPVLPAFVAVSSDTSLQLRTLVLRSTGGQLSYSVLRGADPEVGATELAEPPAARKALDTAVATLVAPSGGDAADQGQAIAAFDIGYVLLPAPVDQGLARILDGVPTLRQVSQTSTFQLWRVAETTAQARVVEPDGTVVPVASRAVAVSGAAAPQAGGTLVLAEPAGGWNATLDGRRLTPLPAPVDGWAQGFRLPAGGGQLTITHGQAGRDLILAVEAIAFLAAAALGLPGARNAAESSAQAADEPVTGRRRAGRARDRSRPRSQDQAGGRPDGRGLSRRATGAPDALPGPGLPAAARSGPGSQFAAGSGQRGSAPADQRGRVAPGRRAVSADVPEEVRAAGADPRDRAPGTGRGDAPWEDRPPSAGRRGRPPLGQRDPAPVGQAGPAAMDRGGFPADDALWDERRPPVSRTGRLRASRPDAVGAAGGEADAWLADGGLADGGLADGRLAEREPAEARPADRRSDRPAPADPGPADTGQGRGGFWGRRGRPSPDEDDVAPWERTGGSRRGGPGGAGSRGGGPGGGLPGGGLPRGGLPRGGLTGGGLPAGGLPDDGARGGSRGAGGVPAGNWPAAGRPGAGRLAPDRSGPDRSVPERPERSAPERSPGGRLAGRGRASGDRRGNPGAQRPARAPVTRGRLPGDDEALPPLAPLAPLPPPPSGLAPLPPPLPRRASGRAEDEDPDAAPTSWRSEGPPEPGEADW